MRATHHYTYANSPKQVERLTYRVVQLPVKAFCLPDPIEVEHVMTTKLNDFHMQYNVDTQDAIFQSSDGRRITAYAGEWVVITPYNIEVYSDEEFRAKFKP